VGVEAYPHNFLFSALVGELHAPVALPLEKSHWYPLVAGTGTAKSKTFLPLLTYLLTPLSTVLLEKLTGSQLVKKFYAFYGTRRFITAFTRAHPLSLS